MLDATAGEEIEIAGGRRITILSAYPGIEGRSRLVRCRLQPESSSKTVLEYLGRFGRPITYAYIQQRWPLTAYQTVFATEPGSAEMPSAGRPFTDRLVTQLLAAGVRFAPILLHTGVSSLELGELPAPEPFRVPQTTADLVNFTHSSGGRVVAVGTTVTRALESAADELGYVSAVEGWTDLVLEASRPARAVEGLITGWHTATATHLDLLEAVANAPVVRQAYDAAVSLDYLWHEFGDSCLLLPDRDAIW